MNPNWHLRRKLHELMHRHFGFSNEKESHTWLNQIVGKSHVADLNGPELLKAIDKIPRSSAVRDHVWKLVNKGGKNER